MGQGRGIESGGRGPSEKVRFVYYNPNPEHNHVGDCCIRALCKALDTDWDTVYAWVTAEGYIYKDMPSANVVWGRVLKAKGFKRFIVDDYKDRYTVKDFCEDHPEGLYVLCISGHVVTVENGCYFDSWDSGDECPVYFYQRV